ncbi:TfpX/TfpZ family type IV pilin accessory protein [Rhodoferax sp.]|uniref:TfpX/TfpZ family type IV pilin accessory protein n=1 Tax=Rhodoferax sp. TaxID=50421 RepID=UPI00374D6FA5
MVYWKERFKAAGIHLGICVAVAALAGVLVFGLWYPYPYREISGGRELFMLVVAVDVVLGPLLTLAIFNRSKPWAVLRRDLAVIALLQLAGLGYGLWTVCMARPVHLVFDINRFQVVHAVDVPQSLLDKTPAGVTALPLTGPTLLSLRPFKDNNEKMDVTMAALGGLEEGARPDLWQSYAAAQAQMLKSGKPVAELKQRFPAQAAEVDKTLQASGHAQDAVLYLPLVGRKTFWTVFVDAQTAQIVAFMPLDPF